MFSKLTPAIAVILLFSACSKEVPTSPVPSTRFEPTIEQVMPLLKEFNKKKNAYMAGEKDGLTEKPFAEATWLVEADGNYVLADASLLISDTTTEDTLILILPIYAHEDGTLWVYEEDLITAQVAFVSDVEGEGNADRIALIDVEVTGTSSTTATLKVTVLRDERSGGGVPGLPGYSGCHQLQTDFALDATEIMNQKLTYFHEYVPGSFVVSIGSLVVITTNSIIDADDFGYPIYVGTSEALGGPAWLYNGNNTADDICFPDYRDRHLAMRAHYVASFPPDHSIVREGYGASYAPTSGDPMDYESPYYPVHPWNSAWGFRSGIVILPDN